MNKPEMMNKPDLSNADEQSVEDAARSERKPSFGHARKSNPVADMRKSVQSPEPVISYVGRSSNIGRLLLLGLGFIVFFGAFLFLQREQTEPLMLIVLGLLAMIGVFFMFAMAIGFIHLSSQSRSEGFSKAFVDGMAGGVLVTDHEGRIVYSNQAYSDLTGARSPADVNTVERLFARDNEISEKIYKMSLAMRDGSQVQDEFRSTIPSSQTNFRSDAPSNDEAVSGESRWFRLAVRPMRMDNTPKPLSVWQLHDITDERKNQEKVFQELQHAIDYLDHAPAGFFSADPDGSIVYLNATLADWLGLDLTQFKAGSLNMRDLVVGNGMSLLSSVKADPGSSKTALIDIDLIKVNGQSLPARLYHRVPFASDGAPGATRTLVLNRSASAGSGDALRDAEVRFTRFFNNTPIAIASIDHNCKIVNTNATFQKLFSKALGGESQTDDHDLTRIVVERDQENLRNALKAATDGQGRIEPVDTVLQIDQDQSVRFYVSGIDDSEGVGDGETAIVYAVDTTEQRALEAQFAQSQKMQAVGQLAGGVAHDFNNVLTAIIGFSDLLLANHRPSDPSFPDIMNIKHNANRAASLVRQLLAFSRRQTLRPQVLSLPDVLSDVRMLLDRLLGDNAKLELVHGRDLWPVKADIGQLEQVIVNLTVNARDAMDQTGVVTIQTSNLAAKDVKGRFKFKEMPAEDYVLIEVIDKGTGMSETVLKQIFEPFFSTKDVGKGTGLGLSTVYGIVKQSGGFIYPDSVEGEGTTFRVFLPRYVATEQELADASSVAKPKEKAKDLSGNSTILLVEDEDAVRAFGARALEGRGYKVHQAESGVEALEVMQDHGNEIDLVVSDVVMPEMDGPTLLGELRKNYKDLKFIFVSGYAEDAFAKNLPEEEKDKFGFLPKPFSLKQLATAVKEMLEDE